MPAAAGVAGRAGRHGGGVRGAGPAVVASVADALGLAAPVITWHTRRTPVLTLGHRAGRGRRGVRADRADLLLMAQTEVGEAADGSGGASSAMPHKANPTRSVLVASAARQLPGPGGRSRPRAPAPRSGRPATWHAEWQPLRTMLRLAGAAAERTADRGGPVLRHRRDGAATSDLLLDRARPGRRLGGRADRARRRVDRPGAGPAREVVAMSVGWRHRDDGPAAAPVVVLGPSLGTTWEMWDSLAAALSPSYRVVRFDTRGHGRSPVPPGPYAVADLADDVLALAGLAGDRAVRVVGLSLGGAIAQTLAVTRRRG